MKMVTLWKKLAFSAVSHVQDFELHGLTVKSKIGTLHSLIMLMFSSNVSVTLFIIYKDEDIPPPFIF